MRAYQDADAGAAAVERFDCQFSEDEIDVPAPAAPVCQVPALDPDFASVPLADAGSFDCGGDLDVFCRALGIKIAPREYIWVERPGMEKTGLAGFTPASRRR